MPYSSTAANESRTPVIYEFSVKYSLLFLYTFCVLLHGDHRKSACFAEFFCILHHIVLNYGFTLTTSMGHTLSCSFILLHSIYDPNFKELCEVLCIKDNGIAWAFGSWNVFYQYVLADEVLYVA